MINLTHTEPVPCAEHEGYTLISQVGGRYDEAITLKILTPEGDEVWGFNVRCTPPEIYYYLTTHHSDTKASVAWQGQSSAEPALAVLASEAILLAAQLVVVFDEAYVGALEAAEAARVKEMQERLRVNAVDHIQRQRRSEAIKEELQWLIGQSGRVGRTTYKALYPMRPLLRADKYGIAFNTERGVYTTARYDELTHIEIKYEGERSFTTIDLPALESFVVTPEEIETYVQERSVWP